MTATNDSRICKVALALAEMGLPTFPLLPGKKTPQVDGGFKAATVDEAQLRRWFNGEANQKRNIGIPTGPVSGLLVIDHDPYKPGAENSLTDLEAKLGPLVPTFTVRTRAGGFHYFFQYPDDHDVRCSNGKFGKGLDIKGNGGYVVAIGSFVEKDANGHAGWYKPANDLPIAKLPDAWVKHLATAKGATGATGAKATVAMAGGKPSEGLAAFAAGVGGFTLPEVIEEGTRNQTLHDYLWSLQGRGVPFDQAIQMVREANLTRCRTPLDDAEMDLICREENRKPTSAGEMTAGGQGASLDTRNSMGDLLNASLAAKVAGGRLKFVEGADEWLAYDEATGWVQAPPFAAVNNFKTVLELMKTEAAQLYQADHESPVAKKLMAHIAKSSSLRAITAAVELSKAEAGVTCRLVDTDKDPLIIGLRNGNFDLRTFKILGHDPDLMVTKRASVTYDPDAKCPRFDAFIERILPDAAVRGFVQRYLATCLTGIVADQLMVYFHGSGENGKSKLIELMHWLLGDYSRKIATEMITRHKRNPQGASPDLLALYGARMIWANETSEGTYVDEARLKELVGGDTITARGLYAKRDVNFPPSHKLVLIGNHDLLVSDVGHAFWRRVAKVPFEVTITPQEKDPHILNKLMAEGAGVFNWLLDGLREYRRIGLATPNRIIAATQQYREDQDLIREFLHESGRVDLKREGEMEKSGLYCEYRNWCEQSGLRPMSQKSLTRRLAHHNVVQDPGRRKYLGIAPATLARTR